jgi:UMF1 family MFS transporter
MPAGEQLFRRGLGELRKVWRIARGAINIRRFLIAFFCYSAGVQTVLFLAATFAEKELNFGTMELIIVIILLQLVAIFGAYLFAKVSSLAGNKASLLIMLVIWIVICLGAYFVQTNLAFYGVAAAVGLVMGGIQSLSRSTYSKLLPPDTEDNTSFFSFYDVLEKVAIVIGTFTFGFINQLTGSMRNSILLLSVFFVLALIIMVGVQVKPPMANAAPAEEPLAGPA